MSVKGLSGLHKHEHEHGDEGWHAHYHWHSLGIFERLVSSDDHDEYVHEHQHDHDHGILRYLKIGVVGAMFTLSPPVSMMAFITFLLPSFTVVQTLLIVGFYTIAIVSTMSLIGAGAGSIFSVAQGKGEKYHSVIQIFGGILVFAFGIHTVLQLV
ncbi:MAG: hypothetical protein SXQ77_07775 [Halobacteria archaeon]|nr:hypothetical protein [Halobacteria archaeon]